MSHAALDTLQKSLTYLTIHSIRWSPSRGIKVEVEVKTPMEPHVITNQLLYLAHRLNKLYGCLLQIESYNRTGSQESFVLVSSQEVFE
jgi:hypothetical protein